MISTIGSTEHSLLLVNIIMGITPAKKLSKRKSIFIRQSGFMSFSCMRKTGVLNLSLVKKLCSYLNLSLFQMGVTVNSVCCSWDLRDRKHPPLSKLPKSNPPTPP